MGIWSSKGSSGDGVAVVGEAVGPLSAGATLPLTAGVRTLYVVPEGSGQTTFAQDELLPPLPLPSLEHTVERFVDSCRPFCSEAELEDVKRVAEQFASGEGAELDRLLRERAANSRNWLEQWWEEGAYLSNRQPLLPFCSMTGSMPLADLGWKLGEGRQLKHASLYAYHMTRLWQLLREEQLLPTRSADGRTTFSMRQFRRLFNCARVPQPGTDRLDSHFRTRREGRCPSHAVVICRCGRLYRCESVHPNGVTPLTPLEWEWQLREVVSRCEDEGATRPGLGVLTCSDRDRWAQNRMRLRELSTRNAATLSEIESAMFVLALDDARPGSSQGAAGTESLGGNFSCRWADKSLVLVFFADGVVGGVSDHTAYDGMISIAAMYYVYTAMKDTKGVWPLENDFVSFRRNLRAPRELTFDLDKALRTEIIRVHEELEPNHWAVCVTYEQYCGFGKEFMQAHRLHPDSCVQMVLQLAYYRLHNRAAPVYETATTRAYYNGRTETVRSCTTEQLEWVRSMLNGTSNNAEREHLLRKAVARHDRLMAEARDNAGCDRHLFGLYCVAVESGWPVPALYSHPAYSRSGGNGNFVLSTSLVGYTPVSGGVAPMCLDGYGCFYSVTAGSIQFTVLVFRASRETSGSKFCTALARSLDDVARVLGPAPPLATRDSTATIPSAKL
ncbi:peroxisomal carnitine O-octanoyltransferase [Schistocerca piceifrons]|uniref:peroxisomal carnitine O-octanoyltransferase n=1 Tax=Schistocerca piceifrons TaxID=274613 RepID=UPI001F5E79E9|nr:peroxisomal carnitine O-octanoyltransferase [Schistocerca piceifrons]XP_047101364.1 peroxisomal carnitine O-octanoyltransferase [Schistocerca piceifrons]XP_047101365.1 peroxisomal carnitine O-octanoyltransferase [Schistocerca piceifrons]